MDQSRKWNNLSAGFNSFEIFQNQKIHKSIFHFVFPNIFFSDRVLILLAAGNSWVRLGHGVLTIMRLTPQPTVTSHQDVTRLKLHMSYIWGIVIRGYVWTTHCVVYRIKTRKMQVYYELWMLRKVYRGLIFSSLKGHLVFLLLLRSLWNYTILQ